MNKHQARVNELIAQIEAKEEELANLERELKLAQMDQHKSELEPLIGKEVYLTRDSWQSATLLEIWRDRAAVEIEGRTVTFPVMDVTGEDISF